MTYRSNLVCSGAQLYFERLGLPAMGGDHPRTTPSDESIANGLERPPLPGAPEQRIYGDVWAEAFVLWKPQMTISINRHGLNSVGPETRLFLHEQMERYFFGQLTGMTEGWTAHEGGARSAKCSVVRVQASALLISGRISITRNRDSAGALESDDRMLASAFACRACSVCQYPRHSVIRSRERLIAR